MDEVDRHHTPRYTTPPATCEHGSRTHHPLHASVLGHFVGGLSNAAHQRHLSYTPLHSTHLHVAAAAAGAGGHRHVAPISSQHRADLSRSGTVPLTLLLWVSVFCVSLPPSIPICAKYGVRAQAHLHICVRNRRGHACTPTELQGFTSIWWGDVCYSPSVERWTHRPRGDSLAPAFCLCCINAACIRLALARHQRLHDSSHGTL